MKATWEDTVLAESDRTIVVEGNHYFPPDSIKKEFFKRAIPTRLARGKGSRVITTFKSVSRVESRRRLVLSRAEGSRQVDQRATSLSGAASKSSE